MLSILIPIYNQDVRPLVYTLAKQCTKLKINYQILCFDDGSNEKFKEKNKELASKININYTELPENMGRSKIRNWLGKAGYFEYLLFLDGDSMVKSKDFIKKYIDALPTEVVLYGGRKYVSKKPSNQKKILHWKYGTKREALSAGKRNKDPYLNFQSNNFVIPEKVFRRIIFNEKMEGYGYEDLLYALELKKKNITILHINNPVIHEGLETNVTFIKKTENAILNLATLYKSGAMNATRLIKSYKWLNNYGLTDTFEWLYNKFEKKISTNIRSSQPSISLFNIWKLHEFIQKLKSP
ncbi:MAG: glycosyltransferase family 2 protein [Saprospiraceae bacterium]|nr:glycosyltransferase family 2 protein [Saprospiraceae bacterium]